MTRPHALRPRIGVAAAVLTLAASGAAAAADPILPLSEVHPGMVGEARTVVHGTDITTFPVTVVDVLRSEDGPGGTYILVRAGGPLMAETGGVADGMSGSPVYVTGADGVARVMGAIALGTGDEANVTAGVTPIEQMLDANAGLRANERPRKASPTTPRRRVALVRDRAAARALEERDPDRIALYPLTRWTVAGVSRTVVDALGPQFRRVGIRIASVTPRTPRPAVPLVPGASLSVLLAGGDVSVGAIGTVTYVDGPTVLGFGHSLTGGGRSRFLMGDAYVYDTIAAPITNWSYKIVDPGTLQGTVTGDRADAVVGTVGPVEAIPVTSTASYPARGTGSTVEGKLAPDTRVAPDLAAVFQDEPFMRVADGDTGGTLTLHVKITSPDLDGPFGYRNTYAASSGLAWSAYGVVPGLTAALMRNGLRPITVSSLKITQSIDPKVRAATILSAGDRNAVRGSRRMTLMLRVQPWQASSRLLRLQVTLPPGVTPESRRLVIAPKNSGGFGGGGGFAGNPGYDAIALAQRRAIRTVRGAAARATGSRVDQVMEGMERLTDDRHDAIRLLSARDNPEDPAAGVTVAVPFVMDGEAVSISVRFRTPR